MPPSARKVSSARAALMRVVTSAIPPLKKNKSAIVTVNANDAGVVLLWSSSAVILPDIVSGSPEFAISAVTPPVVIKYIDGDDDDKFKL